MFELHGLTVLLEQGYVRKRFSRSVASLTAFSISPRVRPRCVIGDRMEAAGWTKGEHGNDLCPDCSPQRKSG